MENDEQKPIDIQDYSQTMKERLIMLPREIKAEELKVFAFSKKLESIRAEKKFGELRVFEEVNNEKEMVETKDGTVAKPKFSNEKARDTETQKRLKESAAYAALDEQEKDTEAKQYYAKAEYEFLKNELKSIALLIEMLKLE